MFNDDGELELLISFLAIKQDIYENFQKELKKFNITPDQYIILNLIKKHQGFNQKNLAKTSNKNQAVITRILDKLENTELITRRSSHDDRREFLIYLTDEGEDLHGKASKTLQRAFHEIWDSFSLDELKELKLLLKKLRISLKNLS